MTRDEILGWLLETGPDRLEQLWARADAVRAEVDGREAIAGERLKKIAATVQIKSEGKIGPAPAGFEGFEYEGEMTITLVAENPMSMYIVVGSMSAFRRKRLRKQSRMALGSGSSPITSSLAFSAMRMNWLTVSRCTAITISSSLVS